MRKPHLRRRCGDFGEDLGFGMRIFISSKHRRRLLPSHFHVSDHSRGTQHFREHFLVHLCSSRNTTIPYSTILSPLRFREYIHLLRSEFITTLILFLYLFRSRGSVELISNVVGTFRLLLCTLYVFVTSSLQTRFSSHIHHGSALDFHNRCSSLHNQGWSGITMVCLLVGC